MQDFHSKKQKLIPDKYVHVLKTSDGYLCDCMTGRYSDSQCYHVIMLSQQLIMINSFAQLRGTETGIYIYI